MFASARVRLRARPGVVPSALQWLHVGRPTKPLPRFMSENKEAMQVDDFPYKRLTVTDMKHMSADMEYSSSIPLRSFFSQHRPLMLVPKPEVKAEDAEIEEPVWVNVSAHGGKRPFLTGLDRRPLNPVPEPVANHLGPFSRGPSGAPQRAERAHAAGRHGASMGHGLANPQDINAALSRLRVMMNQITEENLPGGIGFIHLPLGLDSDGQVPIMEDMAHDHGVDATSVRRKRKLKMNRHKYRKRLKEQRTLRRRLNK